MVAKAAPTAGAPRRFRLRYDIAVEWRLRTARRLALSSGQAKLTRPERLALVGLLLTPFALLLDYRLGLGLIEQKRTFNSYVENFGLPVSYTQVFGAAQALWIVLAIIALGRRGSRGGFASPSAVCLIGLSVLILAITASLDEVDSHTELDLASTVVPLIAIVGVLLHPSVRLKTVRGLILVFASTTAAITAGTILFDLLRGELGQRFDLFLFGSPTYTGIVLAMTLVLLVPVRGPRWIKAPLMMTIGLGLLLTQTRGAQAAAICGLLVLAVGDRRLRVATLAALVALIGASVLLSSRSLFSLSDASFHLRSNQVARHWQLFLAHPSYGYGLSAESVPFTTGSDNTILGLANAAGVGAAILWLAAWSQPTIAALVRLRKEPAVIGAAAVLVAAFVAWMTTGGEVLTYAPPTNLLPLALALALARSARQESRA